ncbi:MAG: nucleotidyltransferase domain-containing protein [Chloroflexi bacterium]|nr:nucleotidyltransferase domain-containing protein [Chloroflexota bacterium]MCI0579466.1 nucleotidyltransferase domain-containing protein [Chloroflexota bacterium]MCI0644919.1 nucleotidyltransferase domain-containing protein [Chloroflexota bacterium]MCI0729687.1 nucleotidyltransferase domain-containing protein [Chloroflexota bacterium]
MIARLRQLCQADERITAAMLYGSFAHGEGEVSSDLDVILYFQEDALPAVDRLAWTSQIASVALVYVNEFGNWVAIFDNLVRGKFHFDPVSKMAELRQYQGTVSFPSLEATILVDKSGELASWLRPLVGPPVTHETAADVDYLLRSFLNWYLMGINVLARGEAARALEVLTLVHDQLLRLARLATGRTERWIRPTSRLEEELPAEAYRRYQACTAVLERQALWQAYDAAWQWGNELLAVLAGRFGLELPGALLTKLDGRRRTLADKPRA